RQVPSPGAAHIVDGRGPARRRIRPQPVAVIQAVLAGRLRPLGQGNGREGQQDEQTNDGSRKRVTHLEIPPQWRRDLNMDLTRMYSPSHMKHSRGGIFFGATLVLTSLFVAAVFAQARPAGQAAAAPKPQLSEEAFKNIKVLRGIPVKEFMNTMGFFAASLSLNCTDCHGSASASDWANYATDTPLKIRARGMITMVKAINDANFGGRPFVTCYTCHRGSQKPKAIPSLAAQYGEPPPDDPDEAEAVPGTRVPATADQILDKYLQAIGGAQALGRLTSFTAKGTYEGFDSDFAKVPVDVYAKAPNLRAMVVHMGAGDASSTYDGGEAWSAYPRDLAPVPLIPLVGADLTGARVDAQVTFPAPIKTLLTGWRADFPAVSID